MSIVTTVSAPSVSMNELSDSILLTDEHYTYVADPSLFSGLTGWWEAFDAATLYTDAGTTPVSSDGDAVYQMNDKSGNSRHWVQATSARRPLYKVNRQNSKSGLLFDGSNNYMGGLTIGNLFGASAKTLFLAFKPRALTYPAALFGDVVGYWNVQIIETTGRVKAINYGASEESTGVNAVANIAMLYTYWHDTAQTDQKNNGTATTPVTSGATGGLGSAIYIGGLYGISYIFDGDFYGAASYNRVLTISERNSVNNYFIGKLAIT